MGKDYEHLNEDKRKQLFLLLGEGAKKSKIAKELGVNRSTVHREIKRNQDPELKTYLPDLAEKTSLKRRNRPGSKIERSPWLMQKIKTCIGTEMTPETLAGRLKLEKCKETISHESIYKWIYGAGKSHEIYQHLKRRKRKRGRRPCFKASNTRIPGRVSIHNRPESYKNESGHLECDTVHLGGRKEAILTIYEKTTKMILGAKMKTRTTEETMDYLEIILAQLPKEFCRSVTFDNGSEFFDHQRLKKMFGIETYFCDSYASWQKGGVENANGILRKYVPKGSPASDYTPEDIQLYMRRINNTPRKSLGYKTPYECFLQKLKPNTRLMTLINTSVALRV